MSTLIELTDDAKPSGPESKEHWSFVAAVRLLGLQSYSPAAKLDLTGANEPDIACAIPAKWPTEWDWSLVWEFFEAQSDGKSAAERLGKWAWVLNQQHKPANEETALTLRLSEEDTIAASTSEGEDSDAKFPPLSKTPTPVLRRSLPPPTPVNPHPVTSYFNFLSPEISTPYGIHLHALLSKTRTQKRRRIAHRLNAKFGLGLTRGQVDIPNMGKNLWEPIVYPITPAVESGIHVFIDCSNIVLGFIERLKINRSLSPTTQVIQPPFSFVDLALILERCRPTTKRVLVGSYSNGRKLPYHMEAEHCGYEVNLLERVSKARVPISQRRIYSASGYASASEAIAGTRKVNVEQGVDEILQLKMLESLLDTDHPSTLVLATGDAAVAEFSGGFLHNVKRALSKGWKVEIVAWQLGMSSAFKKEAEKWGGRLQLIFLDDMAEDLLAWYRPE